MKRQLTIRRLLVILVSAGLVAASLSRPMMAGMMPHASMAADMPVSAAMNEMGRDTPCCPPKAPAAMDCDKCVFMALCMSQFLAGPSAAIFRPPFAVSGTIVALQNDSWPEGLGRPPPEYPPRTLV